MEEQIRSFNTFEELEGFLSRNSVPEELIPLAIERLVNLTTIDFEESHSDTPNPEPPCSELEVAAANINEFQAASNACQLGSGQKRPAEASNDHVPAKKPAFRCDVCGKQFTRADKLKRHEKTHGGEKEHQCHHCDKKFLRKSDLTRHVKQVHELHGVEREYTCNTCGQTFRNLAPFRAHQQTTHSATANRPSNKRHSQDKSGPQPKRAKPNPPKESANANPGPSSSWPEEPSDLSQAQAQVSDEPEYRRHWREIRTRFSRQNRLLDWYNYRLDNLDPQALLRHLDQIFADQSTVFKLNISFGFILRNNETGELRYHHASRNNNQAFDSPFQVSNAGDLQHVRAALQDLDVLEWARQQRPNSKWVVDTVTNATFFVTKIRGHPIGRGKDLPHFVVENRGIVPLDCDQNTGKIYNDNLCFFRALALHNGCHNKNLERDTKHYYERYRQSLQQAPKKFHGFTLEEIPELETMFEVNIVVYSLDSTEIDGEDGEEESREEDKPEITARLLHRSHRHFASTMYLNLHKRHFSYDKNMKRYSKSFCCSRCGKYWKTGFRLNRHELTCEAKVRHQFPGGAYKVPKTIFELLEDEGIAIPDRLRYFPYRATFDFECMFNREDCPTNTEKLHWEAKHVPLSVSVCSNVPCYNQPRCFVSDGDSKKLVKDMVDYLVKISQESYRRVKENFASIFEAIDEKIEEQLGDEGIEDEELNRMAEMLVELQGECEDDGESDEGSDGGENLMETDDEEEEIESETEEDRAFLDDDCEAEEGPSFYRGLDLDRDQQEPEQIPKITERKEMKKKKKLKPLKKLRCGLEEYLKEMPVVGFNSGKHDLNVVKEVLFPTLVKEEEVKFTVKRNNNFMSLTTEHLRFLDVTNFLAPGFSYDKFLKAYDCPQTKGFFLSEWMDSLEKLDHQTLPPHEAFYSSLRNGNITAEEYQYCQQVWRENEMNSFRDFLEWYNNLDVVPFCDALEKMCAFWKERNIDLLRQGISIPGITLTYLFQTLQPGVYFYLFNEKDKYMYYLMKKNMVGGPSIIFHRYHEKGKTKIRERGMKAQGKEPKVCENIAGFDANGLYLYSLMEPAPTGPYTRRRRETGFKRESSVRMADEWLAWEAKRQNITIRHRLNDTEKRIGERQLPVDGFDTQSRTVFQFQGCYWHGHNCHLTQGKVFNEKRKKTMVDLRQETEENCQYIREEGFNLVEIWECQWRCMKRSNRELQHFLDSEFSRPLDRHQTLNEGQIIQAIKEGSLFGCVECDISVPDHLKSKFSEMCPIFKNVEIYRNDIGEHMKAFAEEHGIMSTPRRSLIGSLHGKQLLLATPLLQWYLNHGLEITHVYQVIENTPNPCFKPFGEAVSDARRAGDADPDQAILADTMKLVGNSGYGKTVTDQLRHRLVQFCDETKASQLINTPYFRKLEELSDDSFEVQSCKKSIKLNLPLQIGFFVYQYAKLRMLEFYYDFVDKYLDRVDFEYCEMDTDSAYIAISGPSFESVVKSELKTEFEQDKHNWFPRTDTLQNKAYDKRTPGLFKEEWSGDGIIGLSSKTYYCFGTSDKFSCKGVNKRCNNIDKDKYLNVLLSKESSAGINKGFHVVGNNMYTYNQVRQGFSYFYPKRKVLEDGVSTEPLDI